MTKFLNKIILGIGFLLVASCTVFDDPAPIFEEGSSSLNINKRRVLIINVDGAIGEVVREVMPPTIAALLENSKYTFAGLSDANSNYAATWATILKGVPSSAHEVTNDDYINEYVAEDPHHTPAYYPNFFYRLEEVKPHYKTSILLRDEVMGQELLNEVENRHFFASDAAVSDYATEYLKTTKDMLILVQFSGVMEAGRASGFTITNPDYVTAIHTVDDHIGKLVDAVSARETYADEEWLIIVQSNNGGFGYETGGRQLAANNTFVILNHPRFQPYEFIPILFSGSRFFKIGSTESNGLQATDPTAYDLPSSEEMTVEFFLKANKIYDSKSNTFVFGKSVATQQSSTSENGWFILQRGKATGIYGRMTDGTSFTTFDGFAPYVEGKWDHMAVTLKKSGTTLTRSIYTNGELTKSDDIVVAADATLASTAPFRIQQGKAHNKDEEHHQDADLSEIRIFNKVLDEEQIARHACMLSLPESDDTYDFLIGYYPLKEDFNNKVASGPDLQPIVGTATTTQSISSIMTVCDTDPPLKKTSLGNKDIAPLVFYWLRQPYETYGWSMTNPLRPFELEFLGSDN